MLQKISYRWLEMNKQTSLFRVETFSIKKNPLLLHSSKLWIFLQTRFTGLRIQALRLDLTEGFISIRQTSKSPYRKLIFLFFAFMEIMITLATRTATSRFLSFSLSQKWSTTLEASQALISFISSQFALRKKDQMVK